MSKVGPWSFVVGIVVAVLVSLMAAFSDGTVPSWAVILLAIIGLIVGFMNITDAEVHGFLVASIAFLLSFSSLSAIAGLVPWGGAFSTFFMLMGVFVAPAAAIVAFKELFAYTRN